MGKLTTSKAIQEDLGQSWYFGSARDRIEFPNGFYPFECAIPQKPMRELATIKVEIRKWIEEHIQDTVILVYSDLMYYYQSGDSYDHNGWQMPHGYYRFFFENEHSQVMFKLKFNELVCSEKMMYLDDYLPRLHGQKERVNVSWDDHQAKMANRY